MADIRKLLTLIAVLLAAVAIAACGGDDSSDGGSETTSGGDTTAETTDGGDGGGGEGMRIALLTPGTADDGSWGQAVAEGAIEYGEKVGAASVEIAENLDTPDQYQQSANSFASEGYDLIIIGNGSVQQVTEKLAEQYPDVLFGEIADHQGPLPENLSTANGKWQNGTYLAGVLAGGMTDAKTIGTIGGFDFPALTAQMEGFLLGARSVNPDLTGQRTYIDTWTDTAKGRAAAEAQAQKGTQIIFSATDQASQGIFQAAQSGGNLKYVIVQYHDKCEQAPDVVLASVTYNLQGIVGRFIEMAANDEWTNEFVELGLDFGVGDIVLCSGTEDQISQEVLDSVDEARAQIEGGEIEVPSTQEIGTSGSSDSIDPSSLGR